MQRLGALFPLHTLQANTRIVDVCAGSGPVLACSDLNTELDSLFHRTGTAHSFNCNQGEHLQKTRIQVHRVDVVRNTVRSAVQEIAAYFLLDLD
jgi:hypothetical protein